MNEILVFAIDKALAKGYGVEAWESDGITTVNVRPCPIPMKVTGTNEIAEKIKKMAEDIPVEGILVKEDDNEL